MEEKPGDINCKHEWVYDAMVIGTNPPIYHKICSKCGRVEHEFGRAIEYSGFNKLYNKFHA